MGTLIPDHLSQPEQTMDSQTRMEIALKGEENKDFFFHPSFSNHYRLLLLAVGLRPNYMWESL